MDELPRRWGAYVLIRPLGSGSMGSVYLAATGRPGMEKLCVVKRLIPDTLSSADRVARFRREANIVRALSHGAIAQTLAVDDFEGEPYIVQEFIQGRTINQLISVASEKSTPLPPTLALYVTREVARALSYAHSVAGVVHRDIAPDNVMVTFDGEVRLIDFGIARAGTDASLTAPGSFVGRYVYTAPEVLLGQPADPRADIYSLGVFLWELLTGHPPLFSEDGPLPPPSTLAQLPLPAGADTVVAKATERIPDQRYATAQEFQGALGALLPPNFVGEGALGAFMGRCYDLARERRFIAEDVAEAQPFLEEASPPPVARRYAPTILLAAGALAAGVGLTLALTAHRRSQRPVALLSPVVPLAAAAPPAPPPQPPAAPPRTPAPTPAPAAPRLVHAARPSAPSRPQPQAAGDVGFLLDRARDRLQLGDYTGAEHDAREALVGASPSQRSRAHLLIGKVAIAHANLQDAADEFSAAVQLDPDNGPAAEQLAKLRRRGAK